MEFRNHAGYDASEKIYVNFEGAGTPDNFCDVLMVYMAKLKYGDGNGYDRQGKAELKSSF